MTECDHNPEQVPYFASFEGNISAEKLPELIALLGEISVEMHMTFRVGDITDEQLIEVETPDMSISIRDFFRVAESNNISKIIAGRTVGIIGRMADIGKDKNVPTDSWYKSLSRPQGGYSLRGIKEAWINELPSVTGMGPKSLELIELVITDIEASQVSSISEKNEL